MVDATQLWVVALGVVCVVLALIVFYAARKVLVLKEDIDKAKERLLAVETLQKEAEEMLKTNVVPEVNKLKSDQKDALSKLSADIRDLNSSQLTIHTKVNEQDLRLKAISTTVNQLSVQLQQQQHETSMTSAAVLAGAVGKNGALSSPSFSASPSSSSYGAAGGDRNNFGASSINSVVGRGGALSSPLSEKQQSIIAAAAAAGGGDGGHHFETTALLASLIMKSNTNNTSSRRRNDAPSKSVFGLLGNALVPPDDDLLISKLNKENNDGSSHHPHHSSSFIGAVPPSTSTIRRILESRGRLALSSSKRSLGDRSRAGSPPPIVTTVPPSAVVYHQSESVSSSLGIPFGAAVSVAGSRVGSALSGAASAGRYVYKKKTMRLQFSVGPKMDETAISLSTVAADTEGQRQRSVFGSGVPYTTNSDRAGASSSVPTTFGRGYEMGTIGGGGDAQHEQQQPALLFLGDIVSLSMGYEPLPVDETESVCFTIAIKNSAERSLRGILALARGNGGAEGGGGLLIGARMQQPVEVVLFAPLSPAVEDWVVFLHAHLGNRVRIRDDLL